MKKVNAAEVRRELMKYVDLMGEVKPVKTLPFLDVISIQMVADYMEVPHQAVRAYYSNHKKEIDQYGSIKLSVSDFVNAGYTCTKSKLHTIVETGDFKAAVVNSGMRCLSVNAMFNMILGFCGSPAADKIKKLVDEKYMADAGLDKSEEDACEECADEELQSDISNENNSDSNRPSVSKTLTFSNTEYGTIRIVEIDNEPWFVGKDVAEALGYEKTRNAIMHYVDKDDALKWGVTDSLGRERNTTIINESGLYCLVMSSKLPKAKQFKRWITSEVLPSIRKHGAYMTAETITKSLQDPKNLIILLETLKAEQEKTAALTVANNNLSTANKAMSKELNAWEKNSILTALIRSYAVNCCNSKYGIAYDKFYKELAYKFHINLKSRQTRDNNKMSTIKYLRGEEMDDAVALAAAMCEECGINVGNVINSVNAGVYAG